MALPLQPYKGARDFYPEDLRVRKYMFQKIRLAVERFGYQEYDAPILEPLELYLAKSSEEIANEQTYTFTDRGGRQVAMRPEMTPTISRMVAARRQEMAYPARLYSIPNLWRYERPQRGRLREHWQLNVDIFGVADTSADHEIILLANSIMQAFGAKPSMYSIRVNSRQLVNQLLASLGLDDTQVQTAIRLIDKLHKLPTAEFVAQLTAICSPTQREAGVPESLLAILNSKSLMDIPHTAHTAESAKGLVQLLQLLEQSGLTNVVFDPTLMRGFDYYTDIVFEVFDTQPENNRSMFGGGRYDGLVGLFGVEPLPTVGFGMGDVTLQQFLQDNQLLPALPPELDVYVVLIGDMYAACQPVVQDLRRMGVRVAIDSTGRKPEKQLKSAIKMGAPFALFIGQKELESQQFMLKDLRTASEERHGVQRIVSIVRRRETSDDISDALNDAED